jgi:hypothetical protein
VGDRLTVLNPLTAPLTHVVGASGLQLTVLGVTLIRAVSRTSDVDAHAVKLWAMIGRCDNGMGLNFSSFDPSRTAPASPIGHLRTNPYGEADRRTPGSQVIEHGPPHDAPDPAPPATSQTPIRGPCWEWRTASPLGGNDAEP